MSEEIDEAALDHVVEQQSRERMPDNERLQVQQIQALEREQLEEEEVDSDNESHDREAIAHHESTFDTSLASRHIYLGDVDDTGYSRAFLEEGSVVTLPVLYLGGIVLFPEATLPLRVIRRRCKAAVAMATTQEHARFTLAVLYVASDGLGIPAYVGTTAEIRQLRYLPDGSINLVAKGRQRFEVQETWNDPSEAPCCKVKILEEAEPLRIPREAFSPLASIPNLESGKVPRANLELPDANESDDEPSAEANADGSLSIRTQIDQFLSGEQTLARLLQHFARNEEESDEDDESMLPRWLRRRNEHQETVERDAPVPPQPFDIGETSNPSKRSRSAGDWGGACKAWARDESKWLLRAQRTAFPHWIYRMHDAYGLSRRAIDMWRQMVELPAMDELVGNPVLLSFFIASKMPVSDETKQELLELDVVYRLRKEVELLESMDLIRCKTCKATIARRSDMLVMSTEGPVNAYVNEHGYVHETLTLRKAHALNLRGRPETQHSWFPGYAWTIANCVCDAHMGWRFTALKSDMNPKKFWGIRRSQIAAVQ